MEPHIYGVTEVNQLVKGLLDSAPALQGVAVRGELSNYKIYPSGHHYFTLKDSEGALRCVMFRGQASRLRFRPENGMKAVASGRITAERLDESVYRILRLKTEYALTNEPVSPPDLEALNAQIGAVPGQ